MFLYGKYQKVQKLILTYYLYTKITILEIQRKCNDDTTFIKEILFTYEATFTKDGIFNIYITHVAKNPHSIIH